MFRSRITRSGRFSSPRASRVPLHPLKAAAESAAKELRELKAELSTLQSKNDALTKQVEALQGNLVTQINDKIETIRKEVVDSNKLLLDKISQDTLQALQQAKKDTEGTRSEYAQELNAVKTSMADTVQKIREDLDKRTEELRKFMDNQLRELYPYAYQPKRMDPNPAPEPEKAN